jgi:hypothetical protein
MNAGQWGMRGWLATTLALMAFAASAKGVSELRKQAEASVLLTGTVEVAADGSLRSYRMDHPEAIDAPVRDLIDRNVKSWSFEAESLPDGVPGNATIVNAMSILVVAKKLENDAYALRLAASYFSPKEYEPGTELTYKRYKTPTYPIDAVRARVAGKVYLLVKVGRDGKVEDAMAEQVNLGVVASNEKEMEHWRNVLAASALKSVKRWTFTVPTRGEQANQPYFLARVPVEYDIHPKGTAKPKKYGDWATYIPGPRHPNPWEKVEDNPAFAPDALAANGGVYTVGGLRLKSPLQGVVDGG